MKNPITTITGALASLTSALMVLSILPETLGPIADIIPEKQKVMLFQISLFATIGLRVINAIWQADAKQLGPEPDGLDQAAQKPAPVQPVIPQQPKP